MVKKIKAEKLNCNCKSPYCCLQSYTVFNTLKTQMETCNELEDDCKCRKCLLSMSINGIETVVKYYYVEPYGKDACFLAYSILENNITQKKLIDNNKRYHENYTKLTKTTDDQQSKIFKLQSLNDLLIGKLRQKECDISRLTENIKDKSTHIKKLRNSIKNKECEMSKMIYKTGEIDDKFIDIKEGETTEEETTEEETTDGIDDDSNDKNDNVGMVYKYERLKNYMVSQRRSLGDVLKSNSQIVINELVNRFFKIQNIRNVLSHPVIKDIDIITNDKDFTDSLTIL
tara:strand:- start:176 stop:1033 length:858 start_codon:yes stop_codon:yes gene_type:complete